MGKTHRKEPRNGEFKRLKTSKQKRNKKERAKKANLTRHLQFASEHRAAIDMTQMSAAVYMGDNADWKNASLGTLKEEEIHCCDHTKEYCEQHRNSDGCNMNED